MARVDRSFRRELHEHFQHRRVKVFANGRVFRGRLSVVGNNFITLKRNNRRTAIRLSRIIAVKRRNG